MRLEQSSHLMLLVLLQGGTSAFHVSVPSAPICVASSSALFACHQERTRRSFVRDAAAVSFGLMTAQRLPLNVAIASGGATAGGPYLLSAKQRYNERVIAGMKSFLSLGSSLEAGDLTAANNFFSSEDTGSWKDASAAGFLLANAFRRNSSAAPDSLPSVKKWKSFASKVETLGKTLQKKSAAGAVEAYNNAASALDAYLTEVELPSSAELTKG